MREIATNTPQPLEIRDEELSLINEDIEDLDLKSLNSHRKNVNKLYKEREKERIALKKEVLRLYDIQLEEYTNGVGKELNKKVKEIDSKIKERKQEEVKYRQDALRDYLSEQISIVGVERDLKIESIINISCYNKSLDECRLLINRKVQEQYSREHKSQVMDKTFTIQVEITLNQNQYNALLNYCDRNEIELVEC